MQDACSANEINELMLAGLAAGALRRMSCLKCVIKGAEILAGIDNDNKKADLEELEKILKEREKELKYTSQELERLQDLENEMAFDGVQSPELKDRQDELSRQIRNLLGQITDLKATIEGLRGLLLEEGKPTKLVIALQELESYLGTVVKEVEISEQTAKALISSFLHYAKSNIITDVIVDLSPRSQSSHALSTISGYFQGMAVAEIKGDVFNVGRLDTFINTAELSAESEMIPPLKILNYLAQAGLKPVLVGELFGMHISSDVRKVVDVWENTNRCRAPVSPRQILSLYLKPRPFTLLNITPISFNDFLTQGKEGKDGMRGDTRTLEDEGGEGDD